jgi:activator of HSP90 ATPase
MVQCRMDKLLTRRRVGGILGAMCAAPVLGQTPNPGSTIHFDIDYQTTAARVYAVLIDAEQFRKCSGMAAEIEPRAGGSFKVFEGHIFGRNVELVPNKRLVQAWRTENWPAGVYSIAKFELVASGSGTRLTFDHSSFPPEERDHLASGWQEHYWEPLHKYLKA